MWQSIVGLAIKIITMFLEKNAEKKKSREAFLAFVNAMSEDFGRSSSIRNSYKSQIERLKNVK